MPAAALYLDHIIVGRDLTIRDVTIHQHFSQERHDAASRNRRAMIEKVWAMWITGVLQPSLPQDILLDLGLTERPALVTRTLDLYAQRPDLADQVQAPGTRLVDVFDRLDHALLILGAPGAGKTTLLLTLAQDLLIRAAQDPEHPIPVIFPLSSWAQQRRPLVDWLVDALHEQYDVPRNLGQAWVEANHILPLLDGLDEVAAEHRAACVEAINTFRQEHGLLPLVVCCRVADYEALETRLRLQGALAVQSLTLQQVDQYLTQVGTPLAAVRQVLQADPTLWEVLETPLMLTITTLAYAGQPVEELHVGDTVEAWRQHLFAAYVDQMFRRRSASPITHQQAAHWLAWLAWQMAQHNQTVFYLERMQPDWLPQGQRWVVRQGARLMAILAGGLPTGLAGGQYPGLLAGLIGGLAGYSKEITSVETVRWTWSGVLSELFLPSGHRLIRGLRTGIFVGLGTGLLAALTAVLLTGLGTGLSTGIAVGLCLGMSMGVSIALFSGLGIVLGAGLVVVLLWQVTELLGGLLRGLGIEVDTAIQLLRDHQGTGEDLLLRSGLSIGLLIMLSGGLFIGLLVGPVYKLGAGLAIGLSGREIATKTTPNEGIHRSARIAVLTGLGFGLIFGLGVGLLDALLGGLLEPSAELHAQLGSGLRVGLVIWLSAGLGFGLRYGGRACLQHIALRLLLLRNGSAPWRYAKFLDYAAERILLRKAGGGYIFIHRLLQEYFAARHVEPGRDSTVAES